MEFLKNIVTFPWRLSQRVLRAWQIRLHQEHKQSEFTKYPPERSGKHDDQTTNLEIDIYYT